jgi:hypothetical protein
MESPIIIYNKLKDIDNIKDVAYTRLFENYLELELKGPDKLIEIDSTDQESVLNKLKRGRPVHGMLYTFIHLNDTNLLELQNYKTGKNVEFHDFTPIVFCMSYNNDKHLLKGLNLIMLPHKERVKFFQAYWEMYRKFLNRVEELTEYNKSAINIEYQIAALSGKNSEIIKMFNNKQKAMFNFAYRSYEMKNLRKFRMLEYEEWQYVPFFDAQTSFKKINLVNMYQTYYENRNSYLK